MKVLFVTFIRPSSKFGGGISTLQSLKAISECAELDYMGIGFDSSEFDEYGIMIRNKYIITPEESKIKLLSNLLFTGVSSTYYCNWLKTVKEKVNISQYDCVYLDYTRHAFVAKWVKDNNKPLVVRSHNIEFDYFTALFNKNRSIKNFLHIKTGKSNEEKCLKFSDKILVLTQKEEDRYIHIYGLDNKKFNLYPQCVKHFSDEPYTTDKPYILITGSLWFGPNAEGAEWFLDNVWNELTLKIGASYKLVIAGSNPNNTLEEKIKKFNDVELIKNPDEIGSFYKGACMYLAPIFYGAGMKVKVAEALSCGLRVIATGHALEGYDNAKDYMIEANTKEEFVNAILSEINGNVFKDKEKILRVFEESYSLGASARIIKQVLSDAIGVN